MSRRSTRQAVSNATASGSNLNLVIDLTLSDAPSEDGEFDRTVNQEEEPEDEAVEKKSLGTKRKRVERKVVGQPSNKKVRGKRGSLKDLLEMNFDVLCEIFGRLNPIDLLHLAWSCHMTRTFLMSKGSKSIWKAALANISGLPECPEDLSEPQYANLAFGKSCHFCLRNLNNLYLIWTARIRICTKCFESRFARLSRRSHYGPPHMLSLRSLIPKFTITKAGRRGRQEDYYYYEMDKQWEKDFAEAVNQQEWVESQVTKQNAIIAHSATCAAWYKNYLTQLEEEKASLVQGRVDVIVERLRTRGWEAEVSDMRDRSNRALDDHPAVVKACQKDLTERVIQNLLPGLDECMKSYREEKLMRDRKRLLEERLPLLYEVVKTYRSTIPPDAVALDVGDIFSHPEVLDFVVNSPDISDLGHLDPIRSKLPEIALQLQLDIEERLVAHIEATCGPEHVFDRNKLLNLATTTFICEYCYNGTDDPDPIRYPRVLVHDCATKAGWTKFTQEKEVDFKVLKEVTSKTSWNRYGYITFNEESQKILTDVVTLCGFNPATTTTAEMDAADPILECLSCNDRHSGRFMMRWTAVPDHKKKEHAKYKALKDQHMNLDLLDDEEAGMIRIRMNEEEARRRAHRGYQNLVCAHCRHPGNTASLRQHVKQEHGVSQPSEGDIVAKLDSSRLLTTYRAWPPREEDEPVVTPILVG